MGIYKVISNTCDCQGSWSTLVPSDLSVILIKPCLKHELKINNIIQYELIHVLEYITKKESSHIYKIKYPIKILNIDNTYLYLNKKIIKVEVTHNGTIDVNNFDNDKQIYYSFLNDQSLWNKIDDNTIHFTITYNVKHHTIEGLWVPYDY